MKSSLEELEKELKIRNINISYQRLKVLECLTLNHCHPTVDQIFTALHKDIPTLSKTTVYNTLRILVDAGMVRVITIEEHETRYDIDMENHGHFKCESCGMIYDFSIDIDLLTCDELSNFEVNDQNVYFKGICPGCLSNINQNK
ncbi:MAG: transcriptional repressor [Syntrophomonadaceae bacterium]|nr:transcriptional repressor [Syntrophomonadaceae bacterium]